MRIDKYITVALQKTRSEARKIIKDKLITINDKVVNRNDYDVSESDIIKYQGNQIKYKEYIYIMLNKPSGYLSSNSDEMHKTIFELLHGYDTSKLFLVGRLDLDTEGLLLVTNDGVLCHALTSPKRECPKKYYVEVDQPFLVDDIASFKKGITIYETIDQPYLCRSAKLEIIDDYRAYITITEGKYHQVKKMCKAVGKEVLTLKRISIGSLVLDDTLQVGGYRELSEEEEKNLKNDTF